MGCPQAGTVAQVCLDGCRSASAIAPADAGSLVSTQTRSPRASSLRATGTPWVPVAPYTSTCMVVSICGCFNDLAMQVLGTSKWTGYVVRELLLGPKRFGDPGVGVGDANPKPLTDTLRLLESIGIISRTAYAEMPPRVVYSSPNAATASSRSSTPWPHGGRRTWRRTGAANADMAAWGTQQPPSGRGAAAVGLG
jgi:DNA-binding HxlR family transcriptional regulator